MCQKNSEEPEKEETIEEGDVKQVEPAKTVTISVKRTIP